MLYWRGQCAKTELYKLGIGFFKALRRGHYAIVPGATFLVTRTIDRGQLAFRKLCTGFEHAIHELTIGFSIGRNGSVMLFHFQKFVHYKLHIAQGSLVRSCHITNLTRLGAGKARFVRNASRQV